MEKINITFAVTKAFGNLYRKKCVLIAAEDSQGKILIGAKPYFYPPTIARLLGGGVDEDEDLAVAAARELEEELNVTVDPASLTPLALFATSATDEDGKEFYNETAIYHVSIGDSTYEAGDDVKQIEKLSIDELYKLGERYEALPEVLWYKGEEGTYSWADYAKLYGPLHKITAEKLKTKSS